MTEPLVSYIVPFWNPCSEGRSLTWFAECIESLQRQTHQTCEFLFVDDGSTDNGAEVIKAVSLSDQRIKLLGASGSNRHHGLIAALNTGLAAAKGQFIARLDSDDVALPDRTQRQLAFFRDHPEVHVLGGGMQTKREHIGMMEARALAFRDVRRCARQHCPFFHPTVMFRRLVYDQMGGYPEGYEAAEDYAYWVRVLRHFRGENLREPLVIYREHDAQVSRRQQTKQRENTGRISCEARTLDVESPADKLRRAYCETLSLTEGDLRHKVNVDAAQNNASRFTQWKYERPEARLIDFYRSVDSYFDEVLYWNTVRLWDGHWKLIEDHARGLTLDFGGGLGFAALLTPYITYCHYDPSLLCREVVRRHSPAACILETPKYPRQFDTVICIEVLKCIEQPLEQLQALLRALKKGGHLILVPGDGPSLEGEGFVRVVDHVWRKVRE